MFQRLLISFLIVCGFLYVGDASAQEGKIEGVDASKVASVIERVKEAYGGSKLVNLKTVQITSDRRLSWDGQGQSADFVEFAPYRFIKHFDLKNEHGSVESWIRQTGNIYHMHTIVDDDGVRTANYFQNTFRTRDDGRYFQFFAGDYRLSDLLLAHHLVTDDAKISAHKEVPYYGDMYDVLSVSFDENPLMAHIYISQTDGIIQRLVMERDIGDVNIIFDAHKSAKGVIYASENRLFLGDRMIEYEVGQDVVVNKSVSKALNFGEGVQPEPERVEMSEMTVDTLAPGVFLVGQDDYSLFVEQDGSYVGVNAYPGLKARFEALIESTGKSLPLSKLIVTHHHVDHMEGVMDAHEMGATLLITPETEAVLKSDDRFSETSFKIQIVNDGDALGSLSLYMKPTSHAAENIFVYHKEAKLLFQDDHYHGMFKEGPTWVQPTAFELFHLIQDIGLDVEKVMSGHTRKAEPWALFEKGVSDTFANNFCASGRKICKDLM
jgi:glyoxylase-like metal-dependent hydrolase (beta-lactamase superfamily II)